MKPLSSAAAVAVAAACVLSIWFGAAGAAARTLTLADLRQEVAISEPAFAPGGHRIVFVEARDDFSDNDVKTDLVEIDIKTRAMRTLTHGRTGIGSPAFSADGSRLAFLADAQDGSQIFVMPAGGGTAHQITHASEGVDSFAWRPDGGAIAYVTPDKTPDSLWFEVGDNDYLAENAPQPWHLWVVGANGGTARRLTQGSKGLPPGEVILPQAAPQNWFSWSKDGKTIAFTQMPNPYKTDGIRTNIELLDPSSRQLHKLTAHDGEEAGGEYSPDGSRIMYWYPRDGNPVAINDLFVTSATGGTGTDVTHALDRNAIGAAWLPDSRSLVVLAHEGTWAKYWRVFDDGSVAPISTGQVNPGNIPTMWTGTESGNSASLAFVGSTPDRPTELYYMPTLTSAPERLTDVNHALASMTLGRVTHVDWKGPDGYPEDGVLTYPVGFVAGKKYPLVLQIHGGPNWGSVEAFDTDYQGLTQLFAAHGYATFEPNYRGSDNYGNAYQLAIFNDAGDGPGEDVMAGIAAVEQLGFVDTSRIAVSGWSYGGYMTTWLIGHYHIWKCAIAGAAPTDAYVDYAISDYNVIGKYYFKGSPWDSRAIRAAYVEQSPITYADQVTTPTLILHDTGDVRVPIVEDYEFFHALRDHHVPVQFIAYATDGHYPDDPVRSEDIYRRWVGWLDTYMK